MNTFKIIPNQSIRGLYSINKRGIVRNNITQEVFEFKETNGKIINNKRFHIAKFIRDTFYPDALFIEVKRVDELKGLYYIVHNEESTNFVPIPNTPLYINKHFTVVSKDCFHYSVKDDLDRGTIRVSYGKRTITLGSFYIHTFGLSAYVDLKRPIVSRIEHIKYVPPVETKEEIVDIDSTFSISNHGYILRRGYEYDTMLDSSIPMFKKKPVAVLVYKYFKSKFVKYYDIGFVDGNDCNTHIDNLYIIKRRK